MFAEHVAQFHCGFDMTYFWILLRDLSSSFVSLILLD